MREREQVTNLSFVKLPVSQATPSEPSTPPAPPSSIPCKGAGSSTELDAFAPPTPRTPIDFLDKTPTPGSPKTPTLTPPPLVLPGPAQPVQLAPLPVSLIRIPRKEPAAATPSSPPKRTLQVIPLPVQKHIQRTVHRKETSAARRKHRRANKPWTCTACKKVCFDKASKEAHLKTRSHWLKTQAQVKLCVACDFSTTSPEDFARHKNGKRHKKRVQYLANKN